ncbi:MAG: hypothetical protein JWN84_1973 [Nocardioides sp.]|nr:hypothetical protein [Nocardioides sp.]
MSEQLQHRAETLKLARLLGVGVEDLPDLDGVPSGDLVELRERMTDRLFDESARILGHAGLAARLVPSALIAAISHKAFSPLLAARTAASIDPAKAVDVARRLDPGFLADVSVELDPRRVVAIIAAVPESLAVPVALELARRREHVTMGRFLAFVPDGPLSAAMAVLDDETLLRTAFVLEHKDRLDHTLGLLPPDRLPGLLRCADELGLWPEALDLLGHLSPAHLRPVVDDLVGLGPEVLAGLADAVRAGGLGSCLQPLLRAAGPDAAPRLARVFGSDLGT